MGSHLRCYRSVNYVRALFFNVQALFLVCLVGRLELQDQEKEGDMFGKSKGDAAKEDQDVGSGVQRSTATSGEAISSISSGLSIVGKIVGHGAVTIFGHVEGELHASTVVIAEGAEVEGDVVAEELTIGGRVEGTIRANRVKLNSTAVTVGDIFHRSLVMEESAQFEGTSRRLEDVISTSSRAQTNRHQPQTVSIDGNVGANGAQSAHSKTRAAPRALFKNSKAVGHDQTGETVVVQKTTPDAIIVTEGLDPAA
jgi:cytoskeletal protein CcmA (bactofilin family)